MAYETIMVENEEGVAIITLNRPEVLNAMNHVLNTELHDAVVTANTDDNIAVSYTHLTLPTSDLV